MSTIARYSLRCRLKLAMEWPWTTRSRSLPHVVPLSQAVRYALPAPPGSTLTNTWCQCTPLTGLPYWYPDASTPREIQSLKRPSATLPVCVITRDHAGNQPKHPAATRQGEPRSTWRQRTPGRATSPRAHMAKRHWASTALSALTPDRRPSSRGPHLLWAWPEPDHGQEEPAKFAQLWPAGNKRMRPTTTLSPLYLDPVRKRYFDHFPGREPDDKPAHQAANAMGFRHLGVFGRRCGPAGFGYGG